MLLAVGSELTVGETRDTNSGDLARSLAVRGVEVGGSRRCQTAWPPSSTMLRQALAGADLVVTTGGLGPTPDDLTREAIAAVFGERPAVDPDLERWLRHLFDRRGIAFHETNIKQAWLIPSSTAVPNERGTAPGWWVEREAGPVVVALPGPPGEMRPMWEGWVLPRLAERGLGQERVTRIYRLTGIGESAVAALLGEPLLRAENPLVATYARSDAVDVRISAIAEEDRPPEDLVEEAATAVLAAVGDYVWGRDADTWPAVIGREMAAREWTVALLEAGTGGAAMRLLGDAPWLISSRLLAPGEAEVQIEALAEKARRSSGATAGLAVRAIESGEDTTVEIAASGPWGARETRQTAFLGGSEGRRRAGIAAAAFLERWAREAPAGKPGWPGRPAASGGQYERRVMASLRRSSMSTTERIQAAELASLPLFEGTDRCRTGAAGGSFGSPPSERRRDPGGDRRPDLRSPLDGARPAGPARAPRRALGAGLDAPRRRSAGLVGAARGPDRPIFGPSNRPRDDDLDARRRAPGAARGWIGTLADAAAAALWDRDPAPGRKPRPAPATRPRGSHLGRVRPARPPGAGLRSDSAN